MLGTLIALTALGSTTLAQSGVQPVQIVKRGDQFVLQRNGKPYFIRGVGGAQMLPELAAIGGNSFRTWGADRLDKELEEAKRLDLTVCAGIWLGHKRHGFNYGDEKQVAEQHAKALEVVRKHKDHPSLLVWGLGNEVELDGDDPKAWKAINDLAKAVKQIDPNHPTMTVIAEIGGNKIERMKTLCPDVDILGVNSYAGLASLPERLKAAGWTKPYIVTEYGPPGPWEVGKTAWDAPIEPTSTEKATTYATNYAKGIESQPLCLGSYAFLWGNKQEGTSTWFGMMLPTGEKTGPVDMLAKAWGRPRANQAPILRKLDANVARQKVSKGTAIEAVALAMDPDRDRLTYRWVLQAEQTERGSGGDLEKVPPVMGTQVDPLGTGRVTFGGLQRPGAYRLFVFITDGKGNAATGNIPFMVE